MFSLRRKPTLREGVIDFDDVPSLSDADVEGSNGAWESRRSALKRFVTALVGGMIVGASASEGRHGSDEQATAEALEAARKAGFAAGATAGYEQGHHDASASERSAAQAAALNAGILTHDLNSPEVRSSHARVMDGSVSFMGKDGPVAIHYPFILNPTLYSQGRDALPDENIRWLGYQERIAGTNFVQIRAIAFNADSMQLTLREPTEPVLEAQAYASASQDASGDAPLVWMTLPDGSTVVPGQFLYEQK